MGAQENIVYWRKSFNLWLLFLQNDRKEGMGAFAEKRKPNWTSTWFVIIPIILIQEQTR